MASATADADAPSARHSKTISVGAASALFGDEGSGADFFSSLAKPSFDAIGEEDEGADALFGAPSSSATAGADEEPTPAGVSSPDWFGSPIIVDQPAADPYAAPAESHQVRRANRLSCLNSAAAVCFVRSCGHGRASTGAFSAVWPAAARLHVADAAAIGALLPRPVVPAGRDRRLLLGRAAMAAGGSAGDERLRRSVGLDGVRSAAGGCGVVL